MPRAKRVIVPDSVWAQTDWSRPNLEVAAELNVADSTVARQRARHAPHTIESARASSASKGVDWSSVDWSLGNKDLAARLGVSDASVVIQRRRRAPETRFAPLTQEMRARVDWGSLDWERHDDQEIQEQTGASHSTIIRHRKRVAPHTLARSRSLPRATWASEDDDTIAARYRVSRTTVRKWRARQAPDTIAARDDANSNDHYVQLQIRDGWDVGLQRLEEQPAPSLVTRSFPLPAPLLEAVNALPERQRLILNARFGFESTLEAVGERFGFTRQRANQLQKAALRTLLKTTNGLQDDFLDALRALKDDPGTAPLVLRNDLEHRRRLNLAIHAHPILKPHVHRTHEFLILTHRSLDRWERQVAHHLQELQHYETPERVERDLGLPPGATHVLLHTSEHLYLTRHEHLGWRTWPIRSLLAATALEIALRDPDSAPWHVSELLEAARHHHPEGLETTTVRSALGAIGTQDPNNPFIYAGQRGTYNLRVLQLDDDRNNLTATARVFLDAPRRTLHYQIAHRELTRGGRAIRLATLIALLSREPYYRGDGEGHFTIDPDRIPPEHDPHHMGGSTPAGLEDPPEGGHPPR